MVSHVCCMFIVHFRSSHTFESLQPSLAVNIHVSTKTCATGNNCIVHKALRSHTLTFYVVEVKRQMKKRAAAADPREDEANKRGVREKDLWCE